MKTLSTVTKSPKLNYDMSLSLYEVFFLVNEDMGLILVTGVRIVHF